MPDSTVMHRCLVWSALRVKLHVACVIVAAACWQAIRDYQAGKKGALPLSTVWDAKGADCTGCKWGTCVKVGPA